MKILIPDDYQKATLTLQSIKKLMKSHEVLVINNLAKECDLEDKLKEIDILILIRERTIVDRNFLLKLPNLKLICQTGPIGPHIDIAACRDLGIEILDGGGDPTSAAEFAWLLIMSARRKFCKSVSDMKKGRWQTTFGNQMKGATLGIFGFGRIGKMVAQYAQAFGMTILVYGSERSTQEAKNLGYHFTHSKDEFFRRPDIISIHLRLSDKTREIIQLEDLLRMKPHAIFVNTARSALVEKGAIEKILSLENSTYFALDVYDSEPVYESKLLQSERVLCTPHLGYVTEESFENYMEKACQNIASFMKRT